MVVDMWVAPPVWVVPDAAHRAVVTVAPLGSVVQVGPIGGIGLVLAVRLAVSVARRGLFVRNPMKSGPVTMVRVVGMRPSGWLRQDVSVAHIRAIGRFGAVISPPLSVAKYNRYNHFHR